MALCLLVEVAEGSAASDESSVAGSEADAAGGEVSGSAPRWLRNPASCWLITWSTAAEIIGISNRMGPPTLYSHKTRVPPGISLSVIVSTPSAGSP